MIKNLLNADEEPPPGTKVVVEETVINPSVEPQTAESQAIETRTFEETPESYETRPVFEIPEDARFFAEPSAPAVENSPTAEEPDELSALLAAEMQNLEPEDLEFLERENNFQSPATPAIEPPIEQAETKQTESGKTAESPVETAHGTIFQSEYTPPSTAETIRQSGLAWSAGIVFFGSVIFMMIFGWFADLLFGSSPWGLVGGIVLGAVIGFVQFFRITSQIFRK